MIHLGFFCSANMGAYDSLAGIMQTFAINFITNASTIVLVQQSAIPISMAISKYALNAKYTTAQYKVVPLFCWDTWNAAGQLRKQLAWRM